ncbi:MAG: hypothetical protein ISS25_03705 [Nanoarchaeota archaeon]|nr:hypothetical protein [DPANN group archaeon]MBL7116908.1 hypothetical protein [Nanoarchaeota archaeon]
MNIKKLLLGALGVKALATVIILLITLLPLTSAQENNEQVITDENIIIGEAVIEGEAVITGTAVVSSTTQTVKLGESFKLQEGMSARILGTGLSVKLIDMESAIAKLTVIYKQKIYPVRPPVAKPISAKVVKGEAVTVGEVAEALPTMVKEQVKCVFENSDSTQECYAEYANDEMFGCSGVGTCIADIFGKKGKKLTWKSSCGGYDYTVIDGENDYAEFKCEETTEPEPTVEEAIAEGEQPITPPKRPYYKETEIKIKEGETEEVFGFVIAFEETDGRTGVFSVKKIRNPSIAISGGVKKPIRFQIALPEGEAITRPVSDLERSVEIVEISAESIAIHPGDTKIHFKDSETKQIVLVSANLNEGLMLPVAISERNEKVLIVKTDKEKMETYLEDENIIVSTRAQLVSKERGLYLKSFEGKEKPIKIMPKVAAERAISVLGEKYDKIELKDIGKPVYEASKEVRGKMFGLFPMKMQYRAQIDAESGDVVVKKPWYHFLASPQGEE